MKVKHFFEKCLHKRVLDVCKIKVILDFEHHTCEVCKKDENVVCTLYLDLKDVRCGIVLLHLL